MQQCCSVDLVAVVWQWANVQHVPAVCGVERNRYYAGLMWCRSGTIVTCQHMYRMHQPVALLPLIVVATGVIYRVHAGRKQDCCALHTCLCECPGHAVATQQLG